jgi:hypothetical protein
MTARNRKQSTKAFGTTRTKSKTGSLGFRCDHLALPQDKIRRLVAGSTTRYSIEPFVKQMVRVMDNLKAGRTRRVATLTVSRRDQSRATLIAAISNAAREGNTIAAHETAFMAALYAYENSLDHLRAFLEYLDGFKEPASRNEGKNQRISNAGN